MFGIQFHVQCISLSLFFFFLFTSRTLLAPPSFVLICNRGRLESECAQQLSDMLAAAHGPLHLINIGQGQGNARTVDASNPLLGTGRPVRTLSLCFSEKFG